ncbi:MAG: DUF1192 family protein [Maricaulaceae bacterium]
MDADHPRPADRRRSLSEHEDLSSWSVAELEDRIARLRAEMIRTEETLGAKRAGRAAADEVFKV